jgi:hypothetical protein
MGCTLARAEVALVLSMARAADGYMQATLRYGRSAANEVLTSRDGAKRPDRSRLDPADFDSYRAYVRELAGIARVSAMTFVEVLEQLRRAPGGPSERPTRRPKGAASKEHLLY